MPAMERRLILRCIAYGERMKVCRDYAIEQEDL
jgi:hypothetical protein